MIPVLMAFYTHAQQDTQRIFTIISLFWKNYTTILKDLQQKNLPAIRGIWAIGSENHVQAEAVKAPVK